MTVFNFWQKDIDMCVQECKLMNIEALQLFKDFTTEYARCAVVFYLYTNSTWYSKDFIKQLQTSFESGRIFSSLVGNFCSQVQFGKETENQFTNELQVFSRNYYQCLTQIERWDNRTPQNETSVGLHGPYLSVMANNVLGTTSQNMMFTQL